MAVPYTGRGDTRHATGLADIQIDPGESGRAQAETPGRRRIATIPDWPLILIDLFTEEGIVGRSYLEPYTIKTMRYLIPALYDFGEMLKGRRVAPSSFTISRANRCISSAMAANP